MNNDKKIPDVMKSCKIKRILQCDRDNEKTISIDVNIKYNGELNHYALDDINRAIFNIQLHNYSDKQK